MIRSYIITVTACAMICSVVLTISKSGSCKTILRLLCGIFLTVTIFSSSDMTLPSPAVFSDDFRYAGELSAAIGEELALDAVGAIIKERTEAYILDKASNLGLTLQVDVILSQNNIPETVWLNPEPYAEDKEILSQMIMTDLGIPKENQKWSG